MRQSIEFNIDNIVHKFIKPFPSYGIYSVEQDETGFFFDRTFIQNNLRPQTQYEDYLGGYEYSLLEGTVKEDWQSGVFSDLTLHKYYQKLEQNKDIWSVTYNCGKYYVFEKEIFLHSDYSGCHSVSSKEFLVDHCQSIEHISLAIWQRDKKRTKRPFKVIKEVDTFSEPRERYLEYKFKDNQLTLNRDLSKQIGSTEFDVNTWEFKHYGSDNQRYLFTKYFPVGEGSVELIAKSNIDGTQKKFKESADILLETVTDLYYQIDNDLGIITIGKKVLNPLVLGEYVNHLNTSIKIKNIIDLESYPNYGYLICNGITFYYDQKSKSYLEGLVIPANAGFDVNSTTTLVYNTDTVNKDYELYIKYTAVPRLQYELYSDNIRYTNHHSNGFGDLDLKPSANFYHNGIIQLNTVDKHVSSLVLEMDADLIAENFYAGLYFGSSYTMVTATALDSEEEGVSEVEITIVVENGVGYLANGKSYTGISNPDGEVTVGYHAPYSWDDIQQKIVTSTYNANETIFEVEELPFDLASEDIQLYQVLKIDPLLGSVGRRADIVDKGRTYQTPSGDSLNQVYIKIDNFLTDPVGELEYGIVKIETLGGGWYEDRIENVIYDENYIILLLKEPLTTMAFAMLKNELWFLRRGAKPWSPIQGTGLNKVVYHWNTNVIHPLTGDVGAYYPLRPAQIAGNVITYDKAIPEHDLYDINNYIGNYIIVTDATVTMYAYCTDPFTGQTIVSNRIKAKIQIPRYLNGVDYTGALPLPYGFRIIDQIEEVSTGIGGKDFLTINPQVEDIMSIGLIIN